MKNLPISIQTFEKVRDNDYIYVDKTDMIYELVSKGSYYFFARPRRFGKSMMLTTLKAYFQGRKDLFEGLFIAEKEKELIQKALKKHKGKRKNAAMDLGISERTLYRKIKEYELTE